jgi:hypothetical protein
LRCKDCAKNVKIFFSCKYSLDFDYSFGFFNQSIFKQLKEKYLIFFSNLFIYTILQKFIFVEISKFLIAIHLNKQKKNKKIFLMSSKSNKFYTWK